MINYGYTVFGNHCIIKIKCNIMQSASNTFGRLFPEMIINAGRKNNSFIIRGCIPMEKLNDFRDELDKRMIQYKISKLQDQLNVVTKSSYAHVGEKFYAEDIF